MIKWGIIGPGTIANSFAKEVSNSKNGKLVAIYGFIIDIIPSINKAKSWIDEGKIGKVKMITANFGFKSKEDINSTAIMTRTNVYEIRNQIGLIYPFK